MSTNFKTWLNNLLAGSAKSGVLPVAVSSNQIAAAKQLAELIQHPDRATHLSRSGNGHVREGALRHLAAQRGALVLAVAIERLNDWVPQVRSVAKAIYIAHLHEQRAEDFLANIELVYQLQFKGRQDQGDVLAQTYELLRRLEHRPRLLAEFHRSRRQVAFWLFDAFLAEFSLTQAIDAGLMHANLAVRAKALRAATALPAAERLPLARQALGSRSASIRAIGLTMVVESSGDTQESLDYCISKLLDSGVRMRELARWHAKRLGFDTAAFYQSVLKRPVLSDSEVTALCWDAVESIADDLPPLAMAYAAHPEPKVRFAALRFLLLKVPERRNEMFEKIWLDPSRKLRRFALQLLDKAYAPDGVWLHDNAAAAFMRGDQIVATRLAYKLGAWGRFALALQLLGHAQTHAEARQLLERYDEPYGCMAYGQPYAVDRDRLVVLLSDPSTISAIEEFAHVVAGLRRIGIWPDKIS
ncbi:hypothetical protein [Chitinolyticbacter albus]|uniref:hypothetical protein n=1 Tax=Chitinolyticbacter albus TaxID=2961951 RepID=UPI0021094201|nr:hypothetical protein [Chitinolyticbacter albus]